jgi:hypothetical protein
MGSVQLEGGLGKAEVDAVLGCDGLEAGLDWRLGCAADWAGSSVRGWAGFDAQLG